MKWTARHERVLQALLTCNTYREAAAKANVSERLIYDYLASPKFKSRYRQERDDIERNARNQMLKNVVDAIDTILFLANHAKSEYIRLEASKTILDYHDKAAACDLAERVRAIEETLEKQKATE